MSHPGSAKKRTASKLSTTPAKRLKISVSTKLGRRAASITAAARISQMYASGKRKSLLTIKKNTKGRQTGEKGGLNSRKKPTAFRKLSTVKSSTKKKTEKQSVDLKKKTMVRKKHFLPRRSLPKKGSSKKTIKKKSKK